MGRACQILGKPTKMARTAHFRSHEVFRGDHLVLNQYLFVHLRKMVTSQFHREEDMKNKSKYYRIPVCIFIFVVGSITALMFASVLNDVLTTGSISTDLTDFSTTISGVFGGEKPRKLYLLLEALVVLLCVVYYVCAERTYQTDTYKVTDNISVPVPSGQGQHGTAWFMSDKIKRRLFDQNFQIRPAYFLARFNRRKPIQSHRKRRRIQSVQSGPDAHGQRRNSPCKRNVPRNGAHLRQAVNYAGNR